MKHQAICDIAGMIMHTRATSYKLHRTCTRLRLQVTPRSQFTDQDSILTISSYRPSLIVVSSHVSTYKYRILSTMSVFCLLHLVMSIAYRLVNADEIHNAYRIERQGYPEAEAASLDQLIHRQKVAPQLFLGVYQDDVLIGFAVSTASRMKSLSHESMSEHHDDGKTVCLHSVVIDQPFQRKGIASALLQEYIRHVRKLQYTKIVLLSHQPLVSPLYEKAGFKNLGKSPVVHGPEPWYDMEMVL